MAVGNSICRPGCITPLLQALLGARDTSCTSLFCLQCAAAITNAEAFDLIFRDSISTRNSEIANAEVRQGPDHDHEKPVLLVQYMRSASPGSLLHLVKTGLCGMPPSQSMHPKHLYGRRPHAPSHGSIVAVCQASSTLIHLAAANSQLAVGYFVLDSCFFSQLMSQAKGTDLWGESIQRLNSCRNELRCILLSPHHTAGRPQALTFSLLSAAEILSMLAWSLARGTIQ